LATLVIGIGDRLVPKMTIRPYELIDESDPFSMAFEVTNASDYLSFRNLKAACDGIVRYVVVSSQDKPIRLT
jgi:hypothetical protein